MCFFISQNKTREFLESRYGLKFYKPEDYKSGYFINGFSFPKVPVVLGDKITTKNWGLIPFWAKSEDQAFSLRKNTLNAKSETIFEKPSFRSSVKSRRLIVPVEGFFEWKHVGKKKEPYFIKIKNAEVFSLAGIYDNWVNKETGEEYNSFSIVTTEANNIMAEIHNTKKRMPLILPPDKEKLWLNSDSYKEQLNYKIGSDRMIVESVEEVKIV